MRHHIFIFSQPHVIAPSCHSSLRLFFSCLMKSNLESVLGAHFPTDRLNRQSSVAVRDITTFNCRFLTCAYHSMHNICGQLCFEGYLDYWHSFFIRQMKNFYSFVQPWLSFVLIVIFFILNLFSYFGFIRYSFVLCSNKVNKFPLINPFSKRIYKRIAEFLAAPA